ncbi:class I SAM-dependent methyltransferase [Streptomyces sp. NPDC057743]|uniref:class I SAM-dependent methyltransferase n=1 Tax=Streptomyces sp. NPDC057743 TaxID=3346236 RepID=UPI0036931668
MAETFDFDPSDIDFNAFYQRRSPAPGLPALGTVPWDIGEAQPFVIELEREGRFAGKVLDIGCGLGDNAIFLAGKGYQVTGVDVAPTAVEEARRRARARDAAVDFAVGDALDLRDYQDATFDTVLDSGLYHCLAKAQRLTYLRTLHRVTGAQARLNLMCFDTDLPPHIPAAMGVSEAQLRATFGAANWSISELRTRTAVGARYGDDEEGAFARRMLSFGENGQLRFSAWVVLASHT